MCFPKISWGMDRADWGNFPLNMLISPVRNQMCLVKVMKKCRGGGGIHNIVERCMHTLFFSLIWFWGQTQRVVWVVFVLRMAEQQRNESSGGKVAERWMWDHLFQKVADKRSDTDTPYPTSKSCGGREFPKLSDTQFRHKSSLTLLSTRLGLHYSCLKTPAQWELSN